MRMVLRGDAVGFGVGAVTTGCTGTTFLASSTNAFRLAAASLGNQQFGGNSDIFVLGASCCMGIHTFSFR